MCKRQWPKLATGGALRMTSILAALCASSIVDRHIKILPIPTAQITRAAISGGALLLFFEPHLRSMQKFLQKESSRGKRLNRGSLAIQDVQRTVSAFCSMRCPLAIT